MAKGNDDEIESSEPEPEDDDDIYEEKERDELEDDDEITPTEDAFMEGYEEEVAECAKCKKPLLDMKGAVEREYKGKHYRFCSEKCAKGYKFGK